MTDKYNPQDASDVSMGDLNTVGGVPLSAKGNPVSPDDRSMGDLPTMTGGTPSARADERFEGKALSDRYADLVEIGRGGFAVVYKARDKRLLREIVVKRLHFEQAGMDEGIIRRRFEHEAHAIAALNHPNIVQVYDYDRDAEGHYIVMEYVSGGSLKDLLKQKGKLEVKEAIAIIKAVCGGLAFAHRKNLVHRDIKPANILLAGSSKSEVLNPKECIPKIADFGLARSGFETGMSMSLSMSGTGMGTPYFMPPEQREDAKNVNHTADIYAVGKTLYQLVTGEIPDNVDPDLIPTPELAKIIFKCVKTRPEDRYFSMEELIQALDNLGTTKHAKDTKIGHQQSEISHANACPTCGRACSDTELFCGGCGEKLSKACPECGVKNSIFRKYCNGCGTDLEGFAAVAELDAQVKALMGKQDWAGVLAAANRLPKGVRVGTKGNALIKSINASKQQAQQTLKEVNLKRIEAGSFMMGSKDGWYDNEKPMHLVKISKPFYMGIYPVTQAQWLQVMGSNPSHFKGVDLPVETVSWYDAMEFCRKLTALERQAGRLPDGFEYTLPTEAQWEYACRAGTTGDYAGNLDAMAWYDSNSGSKTHPVGTKQPNAWGLYDMHGNVWEWCLDWYGNYASGIAMDPQGASSGSFRVARGGSWYHLASLCRSAFRLSHSPSFTLNILGFRVCLSAR
ncbi:MAG: SUMF1/EgtB/PvdO family nonheme iron enzyme [Lentisphaerae bacterium]|nr:SUMF1/EgtB/PvdO family nonheme iron enzyme [Lentisphaerota bacterium]